MKFATTRLEEIELDVYQASMKSFERYHDKKFQ